MLGGNSNEMDFQKYFGSLEISRNVLRKWFEGREVVVNAYLRPPTNIHMKRLNIQKAASHSLSKFSQKTYDYCRAVYHIIQMLTQAKCFVCV